MPRILLLLTTLLLAVGARAGVPESPHLRVIGVAEGLPSSNVNGMAMDRAGYLWVATTDGLARYDGVGMRVWRYQPGDPTALRGNYVAALHVDASDRVWVAIEGRGLSVLDPQRRGFRHYLKATHPQIGSDDTWAIASVGDALWFGTYGGGLHRLDGSGDIARFMPRDGDARSLPSDTVLSLTVDAAGTLWVGTMQGLARWTGHDFERLPLPGATPAPAVLSITTEGDELWVGTASGLYRRERDGHWIQPGWSPMFGLPNAVLGVVADNGGHWLATQRELWRVSGAAVPHPVSIGARGLARPLYQMLRQSNGAMWLPVSGVGLGYLRPDWQRIAEFSRQQGKLSGDLYRGIAVAADGGVWLAGYRGELERMDRAGTVTAVPASLRAQLRGRRLMSAVEDRRGRLWIGERHALLRIDGGRLREWTPGAAADPIPDGPVNLIALAPDGSVWLSSSGAGIQQRDPDSGRVLTYIRPGPEQGLGVGDIQAIEFDAAGVLWVAGEDGLARWDGVAARLRAVPGIAAGERVYAFAFDGADTLWLQRLSGLECYRREGGDWRRVDRVGQGQGVPGVEGSGLRVDTRHRVWLASQRGLFRWDPTVRRVRQFGLPDGLSSQEFSDRSMLITPTGVLAAALADGGVVLIDTLADDPAPARPRLYWDSVQVRRRGHWRLLDPVAPALNADDRELRVQLRLLAYEDPGANRYFTRLDGYDRGWVALGASGERVLAGLPAGAYTLRARAVDAAGNAAIEQQLHFRLPPPWWRTAWATGGFIMLAALLLWLAAGEYRARRRRRVAMQRDRHEREVAREASLAKTRFLATLGHEVRTPMTGVLGMSELLLGTSLDPRQRGYTEAIRGAGEHLLRLVNDALDVARIESGRLELTEQPFDVRALLEGVAGLMAPLARQRGLAFWIELADNLPPGVRGDDARIRQILLNLIGNALKFTERGQISLRARAMAGDGSAATQGVVFEVEDTGPGLDNAQQARLFRRFEQADGARTAARYGGSGLGLAISRELAAAMRGELALDSTPGVGSCFRLSLPLPVASLPSPSTLAPVSASSGAVLSLLLVEDDATVAEVVAGLLRAQGHRVVHAAHALAALTDALIETFDAAFLDLDLPGMDGFALARQLRTLGCAQRLIAITARADAQAEPEAIAAGFDRFIRKPVTGAMLAALLVDLPGHRGDVHDDRVSDGAALSDQAQPA